MPDAYLAALAIESGSEWITTDRGFARYPGLLLQASGGVRDINDLYSLGAANLPAAISGRALLDGAITADEVASFPQDA